MIGVEIALTWSSNDIQCRLKEGVRLWSNRNRLHCSSRYGRKRFDYKTFANAREVRWAGRPSERGSLGPGGSGDQHMGNVIMPWPWCKSEWVRPGKYLRLVCFTTCLDRLITRLWQQHILNIFLFCFKLLLSRCTENFNKCDKNNSTIMDVT